MSRLAFLLLLLLCLISLSAQTPRKPTSIPSSSDEFVGPFPSWTNVKTAYGAVADGIADDTPAIQRGLDELGKPGHSPVLFFPRGMYRITKTLTLGESINISIVGEDPATTSLVWDG